MHTVLIICAGLMALGILMFSGQMLGVNGQIIALAFIPLWLLASAFNLWFGVTRAGYKLISELPIFLLVFALPTALALVTWWRFKGH